MLHSLLSTPSPHIVFAPLQAVLQKLPGKKALKPLNLLWKKGMEVPFDRLSDTLSHLGYQRAPVVSDKGEYALRGGILDLFPSSSESPYRFEFFGDTIEEVRTFDPVSQKSIAKVESALIPPASEVFLLRKEGNPSPLFSTT